MSRPVFKTSEVAQLYEEILPWCHPEFPFLDPNYSPGSNMPAIDFTPYIASWLETGKESAIVELWTYLVFNGQGAICGISNALTACLPSWIGLSPTAKCELHAIYILTLRAAFAGTPNISSIATPVAATTVASRQLSLPPDDTIPDMAETARAGKPIMLARSFQEDLLKVVHSEMGDFQLGFHHGKDEAARLALEKVMSPLGAAETAAEKLKAIPPMARLVVYDHFARGRPAGALRLDLFYDNRVYGCGKQANQQYLDWLGFFGDPNDNSVIPRALTKERLSERLAECGVQCKQSEPRVALIERVRGIPGLMSSLIKRYCPEQRVILPDWEEPLKEWVLRVRYAEPIAAALIKLLALSTMKRKN